MDTLAPPKAHLDLRIAPPAPAQEGEAARPAPAEKEDHTAKARADLAPGQLMVRVDKDAGRFVQTLTDANSQEILRRYPSEQQLAYARAVMAYLRALSIS